MLLAAGAALAHAAGSISLQAAATYLDADNQTVTLASNVVTAAVDDQPATIAFYTDATYSHTASAAALAKTLYVGVNARSCNRQPGVVETLVVDIWSQKLQMTLHVTARESGPDTGLFQFRLLTSANSGSFQSLATTSSTATVMPLVPATANDIVTAQIEGCGNGTLSAKILIDPSGIVFDSATDLPVAGATVTMIDVTGEGNGGLAGQRARVFGDDGVTPAPAQVTTGPDGAYTFPVVAPGHYRLDVVPPSPWKYPSTHDPASLPRERHIQLPGSFDGSFAVNEAIGDMLIDLPIDQVPQAMSVTKTASRATAEIAESVGYTVVVRNVGSASLDNVTLQDTLPAGFAYLPASTTLDGQPAGEPVGRKGKLLTFAVPAIAAGQTRTLRYRATIGPLALQGDGVNRAQASAALPFPTVSNVAAAAVQVQQGVFTDRAMVLGKVFADCNANGLQDDGEVGVPGVRLYMEDGSFVVTDGKGQYSFYGVAPRTHVLKLDATTLPAGMTPLATSSRNAGDGASRFVDPHAGELHRADFALGDCSKTTSALIALRANASNELGAALKLDFRADGGVQPAGDVRAQPATGIVGAAQGSDGTRYVTVGPVAAKSGTAVTPAVEPTLAERLATLDATLGFIDLHDGQALAATQATVRVKGSSQVVLALTVDGRPVGDERIGTRVQDDARQLQARDYVGVPLPAGDHELALVARDGFGNVRGRVAITVRAPGDLAHIAFALPKSGVPADGDTLVPVQITLTDARGVPVVARTAVTIDTTLGDFEVTDLDPRAPGIQTFVEGGQALLPLRAPRTTGAAELHAVSGGVSAKGSVTFVPALRPMIAAGIIEGAFNLHRLGANAISPAGSSDGFESQLTAFATNGNGNNAVDGRAAVFLKGKVLGSSLLTVGYDSAKESNQALFRDIQPDQFYPVYGDASTKGFDAQSTSHLYVRLEHDKSYLLYGDFTTQADDPARQLSAYQRSLTGAKAHVDDGPVTANAWVSQTRSRQVVDEIKADGTSGPFMLSAGMPVENSEKVDVIARDRNQPALIVASTTLVPFTDYDIDPLTGRLLLHAPVASFDAELDPQSIRVSYESDTGGTSFVVAGADARVKLGDKVEVGMTLVMDKDPLDTMQMQGATVVFRPDEHTTLTVEGAHTAHDLTGDRGDAQRIELKHDDEKLKIQAQAAHTDATFENASSTIAQGRNEANLKASYQVGDKTRLVVEAASSGDATTGDRRNGLLVGAERSLDGGVKVEVGARHVQDRPGADAVDGTTPNSNTSTLRAKVSAPVPGVAKATAFVEGEQDVHDADKHLLAVGGDYRLTPGSRLYARQEVVSSLTGELDLDAAQHRNTTLIGIDSDVAHDSHVFSEYRVRDAIDGREAQAAMGLRNQWKIADGIRLNTSFERVRALAGGDADDNLAVTAAIEYTRDPLTKASGRIELRDATGSRGALSTLGLAHKIADDWTLLGRNAYALTESKTGGTSTLQERFQLGVAYRDSVTNRVNGLARYEFRREDGGTDFERRAVHLLSSHADLQVARGLMVTGEYAAKHDIELVDGRWIAGNAQLASVRVTRDLGERWDVGLAARVLGNLSMSQRSFGIGAEAGYRVIENLWLSLGYNLSGFRDRDLADDNTTAAGAYLRMRFKFDESLFGAKSDTSAKVAP
jgi:uncharacterized repeat protein (TIGR01451 family)